MKKRTLGIVHLDLMVVLSLHGITDSSFQTTTARPETPRKGLVERWYYRKKDVFTYLSLECYDIFVHNQSLSIQRQSSALCVVINSVIHTIVATSRDCQWRIIGKQIMLTC